VYRFLKKSAKNMDPVVISSLIGAGVNTGQGVVNMIGQRRREQRQHARNINLMNHQFGNQSNLLQQEAAINARFMDMQHSNQRNLNKQGYDLQYELWKNTNYPAQMAMLREAGLNPALLYGMKGGGGTTTGSQTGGQAASASVNAGQAAGANASMHPFDLGGIISGSKQLAEVGLMKAQKKQIEADTKYKEALSGVANEQIKNIIEDTNNKKAQNALIKIDTILKTAETENVKATLQQIEESVRGAKLQNDLTEEQYDNLVKITAQKLLNLEAEERLMDDQATMAYYTGQKALSEKMLNDKKVIFQEFKNQLASYGINDYDDPLLRALVVQWVGEKKGVDRNAMDKKLQLLTGISYAMNVGDMRGLLSSVLGLGGKGGKVIKGFAVGK
jgi:hypothetical protein